MRISVCLTILISLPAVLFAGTVNRIVLDESNLSSQAIQKLESTQSLTALGFRMAGIESEAIESSDGQFQKISPITAEPEKFGETGEDGLPDLPLLSQLVAIPDEAGVRLEILATSYEVLENYDILPTQPSTVEGSPEELPFTKDEAFYANDEFYPQQVVRLGEPVICRDLRMIQTVVNPVQYNPVRKELRVYTSIDYRLIYEGRDDRNIKIRRHNYISEAFLPLYQALVPNAGEMLAYMEPRRGGILIISKQLFVDSLRQVEMWKHKKGYTVHIAPTTEINSNGNPTASQIYNYVNNAYDTWEIPPEFLMIVGDQDNTTNTGVPDYPYNGYTSDHHYSAVDGTDYLPDIFVARLSVDNMTDLRKATAKIIKYESNPSMLEPGHWLRGLSVAGNIYATTPRITVLWVRQLLLDHGFTQVDTVFAWLDYDPGPTNINTALNNGVSIISYRGWAGPSGWYDPSYSVANLNALQSNNELGIMASIVCGTGNFGPGTDPCFGETWIRMAASTTSLKGGPCFFGATDNSTHTKWNNPIMVGYYWGLFKENVYNFAAAAARGKIQQYNTFPSYNSPGGTIEQYFNTYNMLGDPETEVRTKIPMGLVVTHPVTLPFGVNHIEINVLDNSLLPVQNAYVTLVKGYGANEDVFKVAKTDAAGNVYMSFDADTPDTMFVTVSGRDLIPYQGHVMIVQADVAVGYDSLTIDDSGDGIPNPDETINLGVILRNYGSSGTASSVSATLEAIDSTLVAVHEAVRQYGDISPGQRGYSYPFVIGVSEAAQEGETARLKLSVTDNSGDYWYSVIDLQISGPKFVVSTVTFPGGNGRLDPNETANMVLTLTNRGSVNAQGVTGYITTDDDYAAVVSSQGDFGDIVVGGTGSNSGTPMSVSASAAAFDGHVINFVLHTTTGDGEESEMPFTVTVGLVSTSDPIGPDSYGYYMYDNTDAGYPPQPTYQWVEINPNLGGSGTRLTFGGANDDKSQLITLPFDFKHYGETFRALIVCINGFVAPDTARFDIDGNFWYNFFNWPIPDPGNAQGQISPFWDDLQYSGSVNGVYIWHDTANNRFIIEWSAMTHRNSGSTETFQMIITDPAYHPTLTGDSEIYYQYHTITNNDSGENYASVGFESFDEYRGLQYTYDNDYHLGAPSLASGRAIRITTNTGRGGIKGNVDLQNGGFNQDARVSTSTGQHRITPQSGDYWLRNIPPGTVDLTAEANGYFPNTLNGVYVSQDQTSENINLTLTICPVPAGLVATEGLGDRIEISWTAVNHQDLIGYNIYRASWQDGDYSKLNVDPLTATNYTDYSISDPHIYWYYVTAVYSGTGWAAISKESNKDSGLTFYAIPDMSFSPTSFVDTLMEGEVLLGSLVIRNDGTGDLIVGLQAIEYNLASIRPTNSRASIKEWEQSQSNDDPPHLLNTWLFISPSGDTIPPGDSLIATVTLDASFIGAGNYSGQINVISNDPDAPTNSLPVALSVLVYVPTCQYAPGDINDNGEANGVDVTYGVNYFKGFGPPPGVACADCPNVGESLFGAGDVNSNCQFNGVDITYYVNYLKGVGPALGFCANCPPTSQAIPGQDLPALHSVKTAKAAEAE